jgi:solute carrier family 25, member 39/40
LPQHITKCSQGCGTFVLTNFAGQTQLLPRSKVPFFDCRTGTLTEAARRTCSGSDGILKTIRKIYKVEGLSGIYAGLSPTLVMAVPNTVIYFSAYEEIVLGLRYHLPSHSDSTSSYSWVIPVVAGGSARLLASSATAPFEYMRTRQALMEGKNQPHQNLWKEMSGVVRHDGFAALYKGFKPTLWRDVPFSAIYWLCLESMRSVWNDNGFAHPTPAAQASQAFVNGLVSGLIAAACTTPFDVIKTRQQRAISQIVEQDIAESATLLCKHDGAVAVHTVRPSSSIVAQLRHIATTEGPTGLWRGNWTRMIKVAPSCAIMISSYELGKRMLEQ